MIDEERATTSADRNVGSMNVPGCVAGASIGVVTGLLLTIYVGIYGYVELAAAAAAGCVVGMLCSGIGQSLRSRDERLKESGNLEPANIGEGMHRGQMLRVVLRKTVGWTVVGAGIGAVFHLASFILTLYVVDFVFVGAVAGAIFGVHFGLLRCWEDRRRLSNSNPKLCERSAVNPP